MIGFTLQHNLFPLPTRRSREGLCSSVAQSSHTTMPEDEGEEHVDAEMADAADGLAVSAKKKKNKKKKKGGGGGGGDGGTEAEGAEEAGAEEADTASAAAGDGADRADADGADGEGGGEMSAAKKKREKKKAAEARKKAAARRAVRLTRPAMALRGVQRSAALSHGGRTRSARRAASSRQPRARCRCSSSSRRATRLSERRWPPARSLPYLSRISPVSLPYLSRISPLYLVPVGEEVAYIHDAHPCPNPSPGRRRALADAPPERWPAPSRQRSA